jgi:hypothetical protein
MLMESTRNPPRSRRNEKVLTKVLRPKYREVSKILTKMDRLVLRFRKTESGRQFADTWVAARIVRDLGAAKAPAGPEVPTA